MVTRNPYEGRRPDDWPADKGVHIAELEAALAEATKVLRYGEEKDLPMLYSESQAALAERDAQWAELRRKMQVTAKVGIDIYVRGNAEDFIKMMDRARAATPGAEHGYLWNVCYLCHQPIQPDQESEEWEPGYRHFECPARAEEGSGA